MQGQALTMATERKVVVRLRVVTVAARLKLEREVQGWSKAKKGRRAERVGATMRQREWRWRVAPVEAEARTSWRRWRRRRRRTPSGEMDALDHDLGEIGEGAGGFGRDVAAGGGGEEASESGVEIARGGVMAGEEVSLWEGERTEGRSARRRGRCGGGGPRR